MRQHQQQQNQQHKAGAFASPADALDVLAGYVADGPRGMDSVRDAVAAVAYLRDRLSKPDTAAATPVRGDGGPMVPIRFVGGPMVPIRFVGGTLGAWWVEEGAPDEQGLVEFRVGRVAGRKCDVEAFLGRHGRPGCADVVWIGDERYADVVLLATGPGVAAGTAAEGDTVEVVADMVLRARPWGTPRASLDAAGRGFDPGPRCMPAPEEDRDFRDKVLDALKAYLRLEYRDVSYDFSGRTHEVSLVIRDEAACIRHDLGNCTFTTPD